MEFPKIGKKEGLYELIEVPEKFGPISYKIDDNIIKKYAFVQDDYNLWYFSHDASPFGKRIGHASILANDLLSLFLTEYDPSTIRGLHTQEELWFENPVFEDETVTLEGEYVDKYIKRDKGYVVMNAVARGEDGRVLLKHRGVEIMRVHAGSVAAKNTAKDTSDKVTGEYDPALGTAETAKENLVPGTLIKPLSKHTTQDQTSVFSFVGKHFVNIHNNLAAAKETGMERPVVQGQQQVGYLTEMLTNFFGKSWFTSGWEKVKFLRPVLVGETVTAKGVIKDKTVEDGKTKLHLEIWVENEEQEMTSVGWASAHV
ncbi:MaoC family dehydratase [Salibacterium aidingense]|uniref:MaoC family dehydratase n=1 Tax=Salibacterium aidingense TaxID=384933 RepID=UPI003BC9D1D9